MILLCDIGNTRFKWAVLSAQGLSAQQAEPYSQWGIAHLRMMVLQPVGKVSRVVVANVGGSKIADMFRTATREALGLEVEFIQSQRSAAGVINAYAEPEKLGVDRWAAMIAAHDLQHRATCVVSVGTATTIDALAADGRHLGGLIAPGPELMVSSLMKNTSDIATFARDGRVSEGFFANNTLAAVNHAAVHSLAGLVEKAMYVTGEQTGQEPALILTGGASERLERVLNLRFEKMPDLVLRGLAVLARESAAAGN